MNKNNVQKTTHINMEGKIKMVANKKMLSILVLALLVLSFVPAGFVSAVSNLDVQYLKIDGEHVDLTGGNILQVRRGENLPIRLNVLALADVKDVQVTAGIFGYQYSQYNGDSVLQTSKTFDLEAGRTTRIDLDLNVPVNMDEGDYKLRVFVTDRNSVSSTYEYDLTVVGVESSDSVLIKEAYLSPSSTVEAGRALSALVKVQNVGDVDFDSVTLTVSVPELNIQDAETLDSFAAGETETFEKIILRFPKDAAAGTYAINYKVKFNDYESTTSTGTVTVKGNDGVSAGVEATSVNVPTAQSVNKGAAGVVYPVMITNNADSAKTYTLSVSGVDAWGTVRIDPSASIVVAAHDSSTAYMYIAADEAAQAGEKYFKLTVSDGSEDKEIPLTAVVQDADNASSWSGLKKALEIGLIVLVIILILVGLIVGFNKLRGNDEDLDDEDAKTYY